MEVTNKLKVIDIFPVKSPDNNNFYVNSTLSHMTRQIKVKLVCGETAFTVDAFELKQAVDNIIASVNTHRKSSY